MEGRRIKRMPIRVFQASQSIQLVGDPRIPLPERPLLGRQRLDVQALRPPESSHRLAHHGRLAQRGGKVGVPCAESRGLDLASLVQGPERLLVPSPLAEDRAEIGERRGCLDALGASIPALQLERAFVHVLGAVERGDLPVQAPQRAQEVGLHQGLSPELAVQSRRALVQELPRGDRLPFRDVGVHGAEEPQHELIDGLRPGCLGARVIPLARGDARLPGRAREAEKERDDHESSRADQDAVPGDELPGAVGRGGARGPHRLLREESLHVLEERQGRGVAFFCREAHRLQDDVVQVSSHAIAPRATPRIGFPPLQERARSLGNLRRCHLHPTRENAG